ncbi:uncharacterized protein METZ01_LOCUS500746 [marine metagenome]|uniref:Uncharacterized protein n=1 Tax=marine metagenome TaxID=408172 RepID=A0A383DTN7_9ZZZZ
MYIQTFTSNLISEIKEQKKAHPWMGFS